MLSRKISQYGSKVTRKSTISHFGSQERNPLEFRLHHTINLTMLYCPYQAFNMFLIDPLAFSKHGLHVELPDSLVQQWILMVELYLKIVEAQSKLFGRFALFNFEVITSNMLYLFLQGLPILFGQIFRKPKRLEQIVIDQLSSTFGLIPQIQHILESSFENKLLAVGKSSVMINNDHIQKSRRHTDDHLLSIGTDVQQEQDITWS